MTMRRILFQPPVKFIIFLTLLGLFIFVGRFYSPDIERIDSFLKKVPIAFASFAFTLFYVVGTFFIWYLKDPLKIVGATLFGAYLSTILIYIAEIINAYLFFHISNVLGKDFVEKSLRGKFKNFYKNLENINLGGIFILRVIPLIPYRILDLSFGLSKVPFRRYILAVVLASPLRIFWIQFILAGIRGFSLTKIIEYFSHNIFIFFLSFIYFIVTLIVALKLKKKFK